MVDAKDLKPMINRLMPGSRHILKDLPKRRAKLQKQLREFIHEIGPSLGPVYNEKELKWDEYLQQSSTKLNMSLSYKELNQVEEIIQTRMNRLPSSTQNTPRSSLERRNSNSTKGLNGEEIEDGVYLSPPLNLKQKKEN